MGLMNFIRQNLPESWEKAATELKMKTELITRLHANVPRIYKNKYHYKEGMTTFVVYLEHLVISST